MVGKNVSGICSIVIEASFDSSSGELSVKNRLSKAFVKKSMHWDFMDVDVVR